MPSIVSSLKTSSLVVVTVAAVAGGAARSAHAEAVLVQPGRVAAPAAGPALSPAVGPMMRQLVRVSGVRAFIRPASHVRTVVTSTPLGVFYQPEMLARVERRHGLAAVAGLLARELGHIRRGHPSFGKRLTVRQELDADEDAGCMLGRLSIDVQPLIRAQAQLRGGDLVRAWGPRSRALLQRAAGRCAVTPVATRAPAAAPAATPVAPRAAVPTARPTRATASTARPTGGVDSVTGYPLVKPGAINADELAGRAGGGDDGGF
jgi:hypothetical protein